MDNMGFLDSIVSGLQSLKDWYMQSPLYNTILILLILLLLWLLLKLFLPNNPSGSRSGGNSSSSNDSSFGQDLKDLLEAEHKAKLEGLEKLVKEAQKSEKGEKSQLSESALKALMSAAGLGHKDLQKINGDDIERIADSLELEDIQSYSKALDLPLSKVTATRTETMERSMFPTFNSQSEVATQVEDILNATPEELYRREDTYNRFQSGELVVTTYYEHTVTEAVLVILLDVSNSMTELTYSGQIKTVLARATVYRLLTRAQIGAAKFLLRFFDGGIHALEKANTPEEATRLAKKVQQNGFSGGGTEILGAIKTAKNDIKKAMKDDPNFVAEIMLVTDGQPNTPFTAQELRDILGDIKLHVTLIGNEENDALKEVATSYTRYN